MLPMLQAAAASSGGAFTRQQAVDAGYTPDAIRHRLRAGLWVALRRGVYVHRSLYDGCAGDRERHALNVAAAVLTVGGACAVGSHQSAALLHGLDLPQPPALASLTTPPGTPGRDRARGVHLHRAALPAAHVCRAAGVPVTTVPRTVVDLARTLPFGDAVVVADGALHLQATSPDELRQALAACRRWPGSPQAAAVVRFADAAAESPLESMARVMFAGQGLPPPLAQAPIGDGRPFARVDFLWPGQATIVETDGLAKYDQPDALRLEKLRQERLEQLGYKVVRLTWEQVTREPERSAARIRQAFAGWRPAATGR
jgi:very-short-patch-repair endonuclease